MLSNKFSRILKEQGFKFFSGVPDSTLKEWLNSLDNSEDLEHIIPINECEAVALCSGYHLATNKIGTVYMQNSGLGKTVNPLTSLVDKEVYSIPLLLIIGWRGEPDKKDEPQHKKIGRIMLPLLDLLEIPYKVLSKDNVESVIKEAKEYIEKNNSPYALVVKKGFFEGESSKKDTRDLMTREKAIKIIMDNLKGDEKIISTTGKTSRELFECRIARSEKPRDFYTVGSMGCSISIALGYALQSDKQVYVFDGDGAVLMQLGSLATVGHYKPKNLIHIIFDNNAYESTGGQSTVSNSVDFCGIARSCGYKYTKVVFNKEELEKELKEIREGPSMLVIKVKKSARKDLGRPTTTPVENKQAFMS